MVGALLVVGALDVLTVVVDVTDVVEGALDVLGVDVDGDELVVGLSLVVGPCDVVAACNDALMAGAGALAAMAAVKPTHTTSATTDTISLRRVMLDFLSGWGLQQCIRAG